MEAAYEQRGDAPLRQLKASLDKAAAETQAAPVTAAAAAAEAAVPGGVGHSVSDVAALRSALGGVVWTQSMRRMYCLLERCLDHAEPALLVGETGTGKTTVCQMAAFVRDQRLHIINCSQHTEVSDFLGGFRPNRRRERALQAVAAAVAAINSSPLVLGAGATLAQPPTPSAQDLQACLAVARTLLADARAIADAAGRAVGDHQEQALLELARQVEALGEAVGAARAPFEWADGPLVQAMRAGDMILVDEASWQGRVIL